MRHIGYWDDAIGFMDKDRYERIIELKPDWDDVGFQKVYVVDPPVREPNWRAEANDLLDAVIEHDDQWGHLANSTGDELRDALRVAGERLRGA